MESRDKKDVRHLEHEELEHCDERRRLKRLEVGEENLEKYAEKGATAYEETVEPKLSELDEEQEIDRVEESRKRRQAILEKYKYKKLQLQNQENASLPIDKLPEHSSVPISAVPEVFDSRDGGPDVDGAEGLDGGALKGKGDGLQVERNGPNDNWDDEYGHYKCEPGDILGRRYKVTAIHGSGVSSTVVCAKDLNVGKDDPEEVAIKIIHNTLNKAGQLELVILKKLAAADPKDRWHFLESLHMSLRDVIKDFGRKTRSTGLKLTEVRAYAKQLFISLKLLKECGILHCDIKPDNVLVNKASNTLKVCDFGVSMFAGKNEITPYLVSRFYRAPEVILGLSYDHPVDIWSVGCSLYELYSGRILFPGRSNNDMLQLHMELKGPFPRKMLRKGAFTNQHVDQNQNFVAIEEDPLTKKAVKRVILSIKPNYIRNRITSSPGEDLKMLTNFKDLLDKSVCIGP
ncbi:hypothetical protein MKX01_005113 [Papaver californicum]|nr:hypothetical protein MKX01_005113 [Papaver californicum]